VLETYIDEAESSLDSDLPYIEAVIETWVERMVGSSVQVSMILV
jgi:hypothetical protein